MPVPYTFGSATSSIPLSQLDSNFATAITIGNTAVQLGNTVTTLNNMTLANVTISSGNVTITNVSVTTANATTANVGTLVVTANATVAGNVSVTGNVSMNVGTITTANVTTANVATSIVTTSQTLSYGTANGVVYLNSSKVATSGTGLVFDGTNLGLGVTPSAWGTTYKAIEMGRVGNTFAGYNGGTETTVAANAYYNAGWKYAVTSAAARYYCDNTGSHVWLNATSGTAGNAISYNQAMTLAASGGLSVGTTTDSGAGNIGVASGKGFVLAATPTTGMFPDDQIYGLKLQSDGVVRFMTSGANERARFDTSGNLDMTGSGSVGRTAGGSGIYFGTNSVLPSTGSALSDNTKSMGNASWRWSVIYAGNGTINTSDANAKQDIAELDDAEKRVAVRIKSLIKKFRFKDAVAEKGDSARIHVGVIAQDVQAAFVAEGLDANRYGLFCSDTWYEVDGKASGDGSYTAETPNAVAVTRLGVRYDELLAFVISAL